ncbi:fatty acid--CoA ligase family protein [Trebonia kvetii]|uniref:Fatty acid--CoA ligase family protein n=1 Tax=Trebonia kvetii TaxID=2480626 RepID=A0A6P2BT43_9ACTN|nr:AMP-binding protein [Trebonia kvetii]TVZ02130.1 fatty acid--CoA ligase family protein [Trebonia kvetii]
MDASPVPLVVPLCVRAAAADSPGVEAVVDGGVRLTYADLGSRSEEFARALIAAGVKQGEAVALWAPNSATWIIDALGVLAAGAVLVPVNTRYKGAEARYLLAKARAVLLVVDNGFLGNDYLGMLREAGQEAGPADSGQSGTGAGAVPLPGLPFLRSVVTLRPDDDPVALPYEKFLEGAALAGPQEVDKRIDALAPGTLCDLVFTSGTSGVPKGVMTSHEASVRTSLAWADGVGLRAGDRYLIINPFFHSFGYRAGMLACVLKRATMFPLAVFDVEATLQVAQAERITVLPGPPTLYHSILDDPRFPDFDLSALRIVIAGAATVPEALFYRVRAELPNVETVQSPYGLTEVAGTATTCPPDSSIEKMSTTVGKAIPGTELAIVDKQGRPLPAGEDGEIVIRGYNVMLGYFEDPAATAEAIDAAGWLHTGDVGHLDEDGYLTLTGRIKEVFQTGGFNVYPVEVEQLLATHPMIAEAVVIGVPDTRLGEVGHAFVVPRPGCSPEPDEVISFARARIANFKVPRGVTVVHALPRTALGKVQKFRLMVPAADMAPAGEPGQGGTLPRPSQAAARRTDG